MGVFWGSWQDVQDSKLWLFDEPHVAELDLVLAGLQEDLLFSLNVVYGAGGWSDEICLEILFDCFRLMHFKAVSDIFLFKGFI